MAAHGWEVGMAMAVERGTYTAQEAARRIGCSRHWLYSMLESGQVEGARKIGSRWFIARDPFERWLAGGAE